MTGIPSLPESSVPHSHYLPQGTHHPRKCTSLATPHRPHPRTTTCGKLVTRLTPSCLRYAARHSLASPPLPVPSLPTSHIALLSLSVHMSVLCRRIPCPCCTSSTSLNWKCRVLVGWRQGAFPYCQVLYATYVYSCADARIRKRMDL